MEECDAGCEIRDIPYDRLLGCSVIPGRERVSDVGAGIGHAVLGLLFVTALACRA